MGIPLAGGRDFSDHDTASSAPVAIVNRAFADRYWPGGAAVGKRLRMTPVDPWITIVGVVGNIRRFARDDEIRSELYRPFTQQGDRRRDDRRLGQSDAHAFVTGVSFVVRTTQAPDEMRRSAQTALASIDPALPIAAVSTLQGDLERAVAPRRLLLRLFGVFAGMALVLAALGVYGVTAYLTRRRTREMAVRLALGATPRALERLVLRQGLTIAAVGVPGGVLLALGSSRFLQQYLYDVRPFDAWVYGGVAGVLVLVVLLASYVPAHQAARLDPVRTLKQE
jgi:putative ABC transport system permease protein